MFNFFAIYKYLTMRTCDVYKSIFFKMDASFKTSIKARKLSRQYSYYLLNVTYLMLLQPAGTSPLWADHIFLIISCECSGRLHNICVSLLIKYTSIIH